jgi:hypothetical protein
MKVKNHKLKYLNKFKNLRENLLLKSLDPNKIFRMLAETIPRFLIPENDTFLFILTRKYFLKLVLPKFNPINKLKLI